MNFFLLAAGKPHSGKLPTILRNLNDKFKTIDWQLKTLKDSNVQFKIFIVIGYNSKLIKEKIRNISFILNKKWNNSSIIDTFFSLPFNNKDTIISYADTIFDKNVISEIIKINADIVVCIDNGWKKRYPKRPIKDIELAEKIFYKGKYREFTGLILFKKEVIYKIKTLKKNKIKNLVDLIYVLESNNINIKYHNIENRWAEFNLEQDVAKFFIKTKAQTLEKLKYISKEIKIPNQIFFTIREWKQEQKSVISKINFKFRNKIIIIRSSSNNEDTWAKSNAGKYISIQNINANNQKQIIKNITTVINSYDDINQDKDEVLIQEQIKDIKMSGVILTCDLNTGSSYYHINYSKDSKSSDAVTSGRTNNLKKIIVNKHDTYYIQKYNKEFFKIIQNIKKLEKFLIYSKLDIEFIIDRKNQFYLLQVRPIVVDHSKYEEFLEFESDLLKNNIKNFNTKEIYSNMTDWNPAEIIGEHPKPLSSSLYQKLITDSTWSQQRYEFGYGDLRNEKLLKFFSGRPYVNINKSLKSFIPNDLPINIRKKLFNLYKTKIINDPRLHDKIEFEVILSAWTPNLKKQIQNNSLFNCFTPEDIEIISENLKKITHKAFTRLKGDASKIDILNNRRKFIIDSNIIDLKKIYYLLNDCIQYGTLPFAHAARAGFISISILKGFIKNNYFTEKRVNQFLSSIKTVNKELIEDKKKYIGKFISMKSLNKKYGHLREGTYEISQLAYRENTKKYFFDKNIKKEHTNKFIFTEKELNHIKQYLKSFDNSISLNFFIDYLRDSIVLREKLKFEFTKNIDAIFSIILQSKVFKSISREDMSYIDLKDLEGLKKKKLNISQIIKRINLRKEKYNLEKLAMLPDFISSKKDFYFFEYFMVKPNFITLNSIEANVININKIGNNSIKNSIILIPQADPGYDWIFSHNICGLITRYGGANSHMAIRAAELNLPAAIGVGELLFNNILSSNRILLNCENKLINIIR